MTARDRHAPSATDRTGASDVRADALAGTDALPDVAAGAAYLRERFPTVPNTAVVLGSGLSALEAALSDRVAVAFAELPGLPAPSVAGHGGRFVHGRLDGTEVLLQSGRYHVYEGHPLAVVVAPVRILASLGVDTLVLTNSAGGIHPLLVPGDLALLDDVINLMFRSPLIGPTLPGEQRFPDMSSPFDPSLHALVLSVASELEMRLARGAYAAVHGPSYETKAEVRMLARLGADLVGMSTVPEAIMAAALRMRCVALSLVTNRATGLGEAALSHDEVLEVGRAGGEDLVRLLSAVVCRVGVAERPASGQSGEAK